MKRLGEEVFLERLLNIKEAAEFLNVSEMTVRRWTNQGLLNCYRVGKRRARRFRSQDLMACLEGRSTATGSATVALGINGVAVPDGSHITHLSREESESLGTAAAYILEGLQASETVCVVAADDKSGRIMNAVQAKAAHLEKFHRTGKLHLSQGLDSPERHTKYLLALAARSEGRFRVFGDMTWTQHKGWTTGDLTRLEETMSHFPQARGALFLCQYALESYGGKVIMVAMETHSHSIYRGRIIENPYGGGSREATATLSKT
jgi:transcriptional repressor of dcmA and dcmR